MNGLDDQIARAKDLFAALAPISHRKMFGGAALYSAGRLFAVIVEGEIMIKVDSAASPDLVAALEGEGATRWTYAKPQKSGKEGVKPVAMPYWTLPDAAQDDPDIAAEWARRSLASTAG